MKNLSRFNCLNIIALLLSVEAVAYSGLVDPTKPPLSISAPVATNTADEPTQQSDLVLQSLIKKQHQYKAIISGSLYQKGDRIAEYRIVKITAKKVYLSSGKEKRILELYPYEIKR